MSKGIIHMAGTLVETGTTKRVQPQRISEELPTLADLLLPGTGQNFSGEFACMLKVLTGERESA